MKIVIKGLENKIIDEFKKDLNPNSAEGSQKLALTIASISAKVSIIAIQKVLEELPEQLLKELEQDFQQDSQ